MEADYSLSDRPVPLEDQPDRNLVVLLLDISGSMAVATGKQRLPKIQQLTEALEVFLSDEIHVDSEQAGGFSRLEINGEIAIAVFGHGAVQWLPLTDKPVEPGSCFYAVQDVRGLSAGARGLLVANGDTPMAEAVNEGLDQIERRKSQLHESGLPHECRPNLLLLTDGEPSTDISAAVAHLHQHENQNRVLFWAFGTPECDPAYLLQLADKSGTDAATGREWSNCNYLGKRPLGAFLQFLAKSYRFQPQDTSEQSASDMIGATMKLIDDESMPDAS